jgi:hypothetical protein
MRARPLSVKLTAWQMGMSSQLLFTAIITLMKVAILLTYLRKPNHPRLERGLTTRRHLPIETE